MIVSGFQVRRATVADAAVLARHRVAMFRDMGTLDPKLETELIDRCRRRFEQVVPAGEYLAWLEDELGTSVNRAALAQALGGSAPDTN